MPPVYQKFSHAQCSMTVRHPKGVGSGWAGLTSFDWGAIDGRALADRALEKCLASLNPVAIEPGRYTVVLEPQAVGALLEILFDSGAFSRLDSEQYVNMPFALGADPSLNIVRTRLGFQVMDERITISSDPLDPELGSLVRPGDSSCVWIENGVLRHLGYDRSYALRSLNDNVGPGGGAGIRMAGGDSSTEEMIASTKRGILVTRFSTLRILDRPSVLGTGLTRDGLWLIENGKISKAIKNFRFTESPMFALNNVDVVGPAERVYAPPFARIVPLIKVRDFSFTGVADAV